MIKAIFKTFVLCIMIVAQVHFAYAQSSTQGGIIPNGKATFLDSNGKPLTTGQVYFYLPNTTTPKTTYQDINQTIPNNNPITLDSAGRALIWGTGNYRQLVKDKDGNTIWDVTTSAAGSGSGGGGSTATGDGDLVGTIKPWAGAVAPNQYMFTYGQELSRTSYPALFTAITSQQNVFCTSGSPTLSGVGDTTNFWVGMTVETSCVLGGSSTVVSKTSSSVTLAANSNVSTSANATFFMWGNGNGTTTFNLPDFRGLIPMGNNIMGGIASSNVNDTYFGTKLAESAGALGGSTNGGSQSLVTTNLPPYTPAGSVATTVTPSNSVPVSGGVQQATSGSSTANLVVSGGTASFSATSTFTGTAQGGTSTPFNILPPLKTVNYIIKVTPDANSATASGVTSLGGMTGSIACGTNVVCTGNNISVPTLGLVVGNTPITSGNTTRVLYDNSGNLGEYSISGSGSVAMTTSPTFTTPTLGIASGTSLALNSCTIGSNTLCTTGNSLFNGVTNTSNSANALAVGPNGTTNPTFNIDASTSSSATGLNVKSAAAGAGLSVSVLSSGTNENLNVNAKGSGTTNIGSTSTGTVNIGSGGGGLTVTNSFTATGLVTYADMASAGIASCGQLAAGTSSTLVAASNVYCAETTTTYGATTTFDFSTFINTAVTLTGNITTMSVANVKAGQAGTITFIQDATGSRTITSWNSIFKFSGGVKPTLSTAPNAVDVLSYSCRSATFCVAFLTTNAS